MKLSFGLIYLCIYFTERLFSLHLVCKSQERERKKNRVFFEFLWVFPIATLKPCELSVGRDAIYSLGKLPMYLLRINLPKSFKTNLLKTLTSPSLIKRSWVNFFFPPVIATTGIYDPELSVFFYFVDFSILSLWCGLGTRTQLLDFPKPSGHSKKKETCSALGFVWRGVREYGGEEKKQSLECAIKLWGWYKTL